MIRTLKYLNIIFFILMIAVNALANTLPLGQGHTGAISNKYPNLFAPAPVTFSIWGVIYILVAFFVTYQFGMFNRYLGWIVAATIANISVLLVKLEWNRFGLTDEFWTILVLLVGAILGMLFIFTSQKYLTALAIVWAYSGILIKHFSPSGYSAEYPRIIATAIICIAVILVSGIVQVIVYKNGVV